jgi:hypothetical protein
MRHLISGACGGPYWRMLFASCLFIPIVAVFLVSAQAAEVQHPAALFMSGGEATPESVEHVVAFGSLSHEERRELLARMSDAEVRQLVLEQLAQPDENADAAEVGVPDGQSLRNELGDMFAAGPALGEAFALSIRRLRDG